MSAAGVTLYCTVKDYWQTRKSFIYYRLFLSHSHEKKDENWQKTDIKWNICLWVARHVEDVRVTQFSVLTLHISRCVQRKLERLCQVKTKKKNNYHSFPSVVYFKNAWVMKTACSWKGPSNCNTFKRSLPKYGTNPAWFQETEENYNIPQSCPNRYEKRSILRKWITKQSYNHYDPSHLVSFSNSFWSFTCTKSTNTYV